MGFVCDAGRQRGLRHEPQRPAATADTRAVAQHAIQRIEQRGVTRQYGRLDGAARLRIGSEPRRGPVDPREIRRHAAGRMAGPARRRNGHASFQPIVSPPRNGTTGVSPAKISRGSSHASRRSVTVSALRGSP